jgi:hypothetical protein
MTNREKLLKSNIFDVLCDMNKAITGFQCDCVMCALTDGRITYSSHCCDNCGECIARWLGEEAT